MFIADGICSYLILFPGEHNINTEISMITYNDPQVGDIIKVRISSINPEIGAFATMPNGRDGLIRLFDISWSNQKKGSLLQ